jgi:hypothetical protein
VNSYSTLTTPSNIDWWPTDGDSSKSAGATRLRAKVSIWGLAGGAPSGGLTLNIQTDPATVVGLSLPNTVFIPAGQTSAYFYMILGMQRPASRPAGTSDVVRIYTSRSNSSTDTRYTAMAELRINWH